VLAAPSFQTWVEGQPLDIESLLHAPGGRPRHSVFYIAHLSDAERMFFVTLLLSAVEAWVRTQPGVAGLRALLYFDEVFGYLPPVANPPTKAVILRMFKQARAFGFGLLLATQNPVDVDYKALANAGTWCIGKLQTDQDKQHLLDGLEGTGVNRSIFDKTISQLGKRVFLLHNTHAKGPAIFQTRWAMSYLPGPLTPAQIPALNKLAGAEPPKGTGAKRPAATVSAAAASTQSSRPSVPAGIAEYFLPQNLTLQQAAQAAGRGAPSGAKCIYQAALLAQAKVRFLARKYGVDQQVSKTSLVIDPDPRGVVRWQDFPAEAVDGAALPKSPVAGGEFAALEPPLTDAKTLNALEKDFQDWAYHESSLKVAVDPAQRGGPLAAIDRRLETLRMKLEREKLELQQDKSEMTQRTIEEVGTAADNIFGLLTGRSRRLTTSLTKRRLTAKAAGDVRESEQAIAQLEAQIQELERQKAALSPHTASVAEVTLTPAHKDVYVELFGVAWVPYYRLADGTELLGYSG
jgi:hypothetical protein